MRLTSAAIAVAVFSATALSLPQDQRFNSNVFKNFSIAPSQGGHAICITGKIPVTASTTKNLNFLLPADPDQFTITQTFLESVQANFSVLETLSAGNAEVSGTWDINAKLCYPIGWNPENSSKSIQFLIHGLGFDQAYWDFAPGYSYIDAVALAGYPTFSYDRLGTGASSHPDPIQVVQAPLEVEIAHSLIQSLRTSSLSKNAFKKVIVVGHSFGSVQSVAIAANHPKDADAVVLTGFSIESSGINIAVADFGLVIASDAEPARFRSLANGYLVTPTAASNQFAFFRYPNFDPKIFALDESSKQTFTLGELLTQTTIIAPASNFTGPLDIVLGQNDLIFCQADCEFPSDQASRVQPALFPNSTKGSETFVLQGAGHAINLHLNAKEAFDHINEFVKKNGF